MSCQGLRLRCGSSPFILLALSAVPALWPEAEWTSILRGEMRVEAELARAQAHGYYENLLTGPGAGTRQAAAATTGSQAAVGPEIKVPPGWKPFAESGIVEPVDSFLRWRMKPNLRTTWNGRRFSTNRLGYRTPEISIPKPTDTYRIVVLGSSNTMGHGVHDHEPFVRLLEDWLSSPEIGLNRKVEVVNLAVSSDSPSQSLLRLQSDVPALEADWILNDITVLDYSLEELHLHSVVRRDVPIPFSYLREILASAGATSDDSLAEFGEKLRGSMGEVLDGSYKGWADECEGLGVPMTLLQLPRTDAEVENPNLRRMADRLARGHGLPMIDLTEAYGTRPISEYRLSPWDKHPSALGHRLIFENLRDELIRSGGAPGLPLQSGPSPEDDGAPSVPLNPA